ncbi:response regulator transcription factor [Clostridium uliginosum]|uniref:Stage 0 sporulation protein A homolog n=1 Tax=Clostridium uliginosum TaxID=119641 RepID=A0A1I1I4G7_9CLOT|nr:response regulator [Clostridium uliginosum]SFC30935.1 Two-component response regulator, YesN/AraC family, consists of REC and AraC-type DNA-binding domains [Clostridium uliginosum]
MIKVVIVDDEYYSRKGLRCIIPWKNMNCSVCGEATNAYEAIELAKEINPDIIVTDINMPEIDGIEMAKRIKQFLPNVKFIVITGHDEFQYARGAVKINALDFILKPIQVPEFTEAIMNAVNIIKKEKESDKSTVEKHLLSIMRGQSPIEEVDNYLDNLKSVKVVLINNDSYEHFIDKNKEFLNIQFISIIKKWVLDNIEKYYVFVPHDNRIGLILYGDMDIDFKVLIKKIKKDIQGVITISITKVGPAIKLKELYRIAKGLYGRCFYEGYGNVLEETKPINVYSNYEKMNSIITAIIDEILNANTKTSDKNIDELFKIFSDYMIKKRVIIKLVFELILKIKERLKALDISINNLENIELENDYRQMIDLKNDLEKFIDLAIENVREYRGELEDSSIKRAIKFINDNYNKNISLTVVANSVYLNESYLSRELKQVLGIGFLEYIRKLRIERSIELLKKRYSLATIAKEVGYSDYRQFTYNFKKYTGDIPSNYKIK